MDAPRSQRDRQGGSGAVSEGIRINVRRDYAALLRAKTTPGVRYEGEYAVFPTWDTASREISEALTSHAPHLHDYQRFAVTFAVARQRAALFMECGLGKASSGIAWVEHVRKGRPAIICAPLAALHEFENERDKFFPSLPLRLVPTADFGAWLASPEGVALVTHHAFVQERDLSGVAALVLDESSVLKSGSGVIATNLARAARPLAHRLCLSATPAPNDPTEYAQHAVFLGYMRSDAEFRARFFVRDGRDWRVKGHAKAALPRWLSRFALWMRDPAAYGMPCPALPEGEPEVEIVDLSPLEHDGPTDLFGVPIGKQGMSDRSRIRNDLYAEEERTRRVVELARGGPSVVWALRNAHADALEKALAEAGIRVAQIAGTTPDEERVEIVRRFQAGELDCIVSKAKCIGHGVNLQRAERMIYAGYDESYETLHQTMRRGWRQGRTGPFRAFLLMAPEERATVDALWTKAAQWKEDSERQEREFSAALSGDLEAYHQGLTMSVHEDTSERLPEVRTEHYWLQHGDSIACMGALPDMQTIPDESVDLSVFSPPFSSLFTYSSESADMGNCSDQATEEFNLHFIHFAEGLFRVMKQGRVVCLHLAQLIAFRARHGRKGLRDFRGDVIRLMEEAGFHYYGEFVIPKNPQALRDGTMVATPDGWKAINALSVGDLVIGSDGKPTRVEGVHPQGERQLYAVEFSDGETIYCDDRHLWTVEKASGVIETLTTEAIRSHGLRMPSGEWRYKIPVLPEPVEYAESSPLPVDPHLLGALLGDGGMTTRSRVSICTDRSLVESMASALPEGHRFADRGGERAGGAVASYDIVSDKWHHNESLNALRELGLHGCAAGDKFIPEAYLLASVEDRWRLLQGLLDTDGTVKTSGGRSVQVEYSSTSEQLARDVVRLAQSLGGIATLRTDNEAWRENPLWLVRIALAGDRCPFTLERKAAKWRPRRRRPVRRIVDIRPAMVDCCTCITVAAEDGLFATEGFVVTHNSVAIRTKSERLQFAQFRRDSLESSPALNDYVLEFRKPGKQAVPVIPRMTQEEWISVASGVWSDIRETDVLPGSRAASGAEDEKHIAPLQLPVIDRCIRLWSNAGEVVFTPFAGIGSEIDQAVRLGNVGWGIELKAEYFRQACANAEAAEIATYGSQNDFSEFLQMQEA